MQGETISVLTGRAIFIDPNTNDTWKEGQRIKRIKLAETLEIIANEGAMALYNGTLTKLLIDDIQELGGILTEDDMHNYQYVSRTIIYKQIS